ncbi:MAG TPA: N-acetyltransferase family protein [Phycisphaerales bacterium]|nr:N-acetyltransferase family protein [Phycisphaerales bacterium]
MPTDPSTILIRLAHAADIPAILEISNHAALSSPANFATEPDLLDDWLRAWRDTHEKHPWLIACNAQERIIGFAKTSPWKGRCAYRWAVETTVYIAPGFQGQGIGRALYAKLFPLLRAQGYHSAIAGITQPNEPSVRLHESFGMKRVALFERIGWKFNAWHDVGYWLVELGTPTEPIAIRTVAEALAECPLMAETRRA